MNCLYYLDHGSIYTYSTDRSFYLIMKKYLDYKLGQTKKEDQIINLEYVKKIEQIKDKLGFSLNVMNSNGCQRKSTDMGISYTFSSGRNIDETFQKAN